MFGHGIDVCRCGAVIRQCRCPGPHARRLVQLVCGACRATAPVVLAQEVPHVVAPESAPQQAEGQGGAKTARERAVEAIAFGMGAEPACVEDAYEVIAERFVKRIERAGLVVVDAKEHAAERERLAILDRAIAVGRAPACTWTELNAAIDPLDALVYGPKGPSDEEISAELERRAAGETH